MLLFSAREANAYLTSCLGIGGEAPPPAQRQDEPAQKGVSQERTFEPTGSEAKLRQWCTELATRLAALEVSVETKVRDAMRRVETAVARDVTESVDRRVDVRLRESERAVIERAPDLAEAHHHLAVVLHGMGKTVEAVRSLRHGLDLDPHLVGAEVRLELYLAELGERRSA